MSEVSFTTLSNAKALIFNKKLVLDSHCDNIDARPCYFATQRPLITTFTQNCLCLQISDKFNV